MNCDSTRNSVQGLQSVILLINDTSSSFFRFSPERPNEKTLFQTVPTRLLSCHHFGWALPGSAQRRFEEGCTKEFQPRFFDFPHGDQTKKHSLERFLQGRFHATILGGNFQKAPKDSLTEIAPKSSNRIFSTFPIGAKRKTTLWNGSFEVVFMPPFWVGTYR